MSQNTAIEWTDVTWNPMVGCTPVSEGCDHCYAEAQNAFRGWTKWGPHGARRRTSPANWRKPLRWEADAKNFLQSYGRRYAPGVLGPALNECLRHDIRGNGFIVDGGLIGSGEYARVRVRGRFDVVLKRRPSAEDPVVVSGLDFAARASNRRHTPRKGRQPQRRAA